MKCMRALPSPPPLSNGGLSPAPTPTLCPSAAYAVTGPTSDGFPNKIGFFEEKVIENWRILDLERGRVGGASGLYSGKRGERQNTGAVGSKREKTFGFPHWMHLNSPMYCFVPLVSIFCILSISCLRNMFMGSIPPRRTRASLTSWAT